jgi:hypothetical protein
MIEQARKIFNKKDLTLDDYNEFIELENKMKSSYDKFEYTWLAEGFKLRLPEIAEKVGSYSFIKNQDF